MEMQFSFLDMVFNNTLKSVVKVDVQVGIDFVYKVTLSYIFHAL